MEGSWLIGLVALLGVLFLMTRGVPMRQVLVVVAATLALVLILLLVERSGLWPSAWRTR